MAMRKLEIKRTTHEKLEAEQRETWQRMTPQERLALVEELRLDAGRMGLYEYPCRFQRVIKVIKPSQS